MSNRVGLMEAFAPSCDAVSAVPSDHPPIRPPRIGVLLLNLGTPDGTDYWSMRRYLGEFLSDRRIIELSPLIWQPILQGIILTLRPKKSGRAYAEIWNREKNESPLLTITRDQTDGVRQVISDRYNNVSVEFAMRYGNPSTESGVRKLIDQGCQRILIFPLYPQYSAATTATACDHAFRALMKARWQPAVRTMPAYYEHPGYIRALADSVRAHYATLDWEPEVLLASFHGLPKENLDKGDPYHCQCHKTTRLLREELGWPEERLRITFQSRFGPKEWLQPYTDVTVEELAQQGIKSIAVITPGFSADCVETLEEIDIGVRETFLENGGQNFAYVPCLNDSPGHLQFLAQLVEEELAGWLAAPELGATAATAATAGSR